jgi:hypothetical protein
MMTPAVWSVLVDIGHHPTTKRATQDRGVLLSAYKAPDIIVTRYFAKGGYATRFWAIYLNGELLAVTVYRKGAIAIAQKLAG